MRTPTPRRRRSYGERRIIEVLSMHATGQISYDSLALIVGMDRRSVIWIVRRLEHRGQLRILEHGCGRRPHRYELVS